MKAYPQRHFEENDKYLKEKRTMNKKIDAAVKFRAFLYHKDLAPKGRIFTSQKDYDAALKEGWKTGIDSSKAAKPDKRPRAKK